MSSCAANLSLAIIWHYKCQQVGCSMGLSKGCPSVEHFLYLSLSELDAGCVTCSSTVQWYCSQARGIVYRM